ncbi:MAG TPA: mobile mystery protein A [Cyclobacteriaceae bacterium]|nr:mobile mystery protein A [Cyclobacteriaceae bacterium]
MKRVKKLQLAQLDRKIAALATVPEPPSNGWISAIRTTIGMSFRQLAKRLKIAPQNAQAFEKRELEGSITIKNLRTIAQALNMKLVYGFIPQSGSLEKMIEDQAMSVAKKIVLRTDTTMKLEDQGVSKERRDQAILELAEEIKRNIPRYLWD